MHFIRRLRNASLTHFAHDEAALSAVHIAGVFLVLPIISMIIFEASLDSGLGFAHDALSEARAFYYSRPIVDIGRYGRRCMMSHNR